MFQSLIDRNIVIQSDRILSKSYLNPATPENQVHWTLDVTFSEDQCRIRSGNAPHNFALLRRMALNALNLEKTLPRSLRQKSQRASMNNDYMMTVLKCFCQ